MFENENLPARKGFLVGVNGSFDMPGADMAKRFGPGYRVGLSCHYKTKSNWVFGMKLDFLNGSSIREDSLFSGVIGPDSTFINQDGQRLYVQKFKRGFMLGAEAGYIFRLTPKLQDAGILVMTGAGFMQHRILIKDKSESIVALQGDYRKGYDRLTNGIYVEQYVGYVFLSNTGLVNFHLGLDVVAGFTQGRRDFLYDVRRPGTDKRVDIMFGVRGGWILPIFKRKSEDYYFE
ncbi:hypothetical protein GCM10023092_13830 [Rurimicrobium arvi]|uniref:Outer membrane protein beta-barrel domain-containing protein n=1 Tax=Rurimicrobium arvi TaxID=2049916 RepID=A0ABP8MS94_9BACT